MKKAVTAGQIADWFAIGTQSAKQNAEKEMRESGTEANASPGDHEERNYSECFDGVRRLRFDSSSEPPPVLTSVEYPSLPITKDRHELVSLIENNSVVIIRGATGSGKTTQLPQFVLDYYNERHVPCNLVVTQPRKIGASSIARWVARQRKCALGSLVGYQVGLEKMASEHTRLIYMTTGVLLQKLVGAKSLTEYSHIFIDEVHERTEELDFLLLVIRKLLFSNSRHVRVILMSATINCKEFAEYFGTPLLSQLNPAYVFEVEGAPYAIEQFYLDNLRGLIPFSAVPMHWDEPGISVQMYSVAISLIESFDTMEEKDQSRKEETKGFVQLPERGSVLVFLPGLAEIQYMQDALSKLGRKRLQVYPLHSTVTLEEQNEVFLVPVPGYRKIILSTNIAESSVTVPDVKYVIDFCLARHLVCDRDTNYRSLRLTWSSKTNCNQRRGRAGRVSKGYCYRLVTKDFWEREIPDFVIPEMQRAPLDSILLKVKLLDMGDPRTLLSTALSPPNLSDIERTVLKLKAMGALSVNSPSQKRYDGDMTFLGRVLAHLPVSLHLGKMIVLGHVFGVLDDCLIIAACVSIKSFFNAPHLQPLAGYRSKLMFANAVPSDYIACLNAFKTWHSLKTKGEFRHAKDELDWGKENCISIKRVREAAELFEDLRKRVAQFNMHPNSSHSSLDYTNLHMQKFILQVVIAGAFYPDYYLQGEIDDELAAKELSGYDPSTTVVIRNMPPFAFLYYKQVQSLFRQCGQVKSIAFDSTRAYVEFCRSAGAGVLQEVSLALLLAQKKQELKLTVFSSEEVETHAGEMAMITHLRNARVNVDLLNHTVSPVDFLSNIDPERLPSNRVFIINITKVMEVGHFWGFQAGEASVKKLRQLTADINACELQPLTSSLYPNLLCLAPFSEDGEVDASPRYYRAKILHVPSSSAEVEVFFLDFGNTARVSINSLREMPSELQTLPFQALEFRLAFLAPSAQSMICGEQWSRRARNRFATLVHGRALAALLNSVLHGVVRVDLLVPTEIADSVSVTDILVQEGHARRAPECFESKQSHEALMSMYEDLANGTFLQNSASPSWTEQKQRDKLHINKLLDPKTSPGNPKGKCLVHGPYSPNKVKFYSMSHTSLFRPVLLEKDSINQVAINDNPQYTHNRMLVAGSVSVSGSGSGIQLRETTLMPHILGLPALITIIFCPVMELRTDEERKHFTGALCGLGPTVQSQDGLLPDNDIELTFDVRIDTDDISEINNLRAAINRLVCEGPNGVLHLIPEKISTFQQDARDRLIRLFTRSPPREDTEPIYHQKPKKWNQVEASHLMDISNEGEKNSKGHLFQMHSITVLGM
ncbi:ATP-dependent RNA helicase TDRD9 [Clupea harengus]|uniref:ATP-dependent RNA helicase TDRD9 n=1 Tax=Clupea harengus TaxID=7950 RepID=A0A6P8GW86_CLUHA|nr:ATP-dependent RNA helicase TDRD9 [Clupea harengus]